MLGKINRIQMNTPLIDESTQEQRDLIQSTLPPIGAIELLKQARDELLAANPEAKFGLSIGCVSDSLDVSFHGVESYAEACTILRRFGIRTWKKHPHEGDSYITGKAEGIEVSVFFSGLPPTCHVEEYIEQVPKTETVDTGEFIEVKRTRIVCADKQEL